MAMHNAVFLANENAALRAANRKQIRKRAIEARSISQGGILTVQEARNRFQLIENEAAAASQPPGYQPRMRALPRCSICSSLEYTARKCPKSYETS